MGLREWFASRSDRRRSSRIRPQDLTASFWTGGNAPPRPVRDISIGGARVAGSPVFYPGTILRIVLQAAAVPPDSTKGFDFVCVHAKVCRKTDDGFCVAFIYQNHRERLRLQRFLDQLKTREGETTVVVSAQVLAPDRQGSST